MSICHSLSDIYMVPAFHALSDVIATTDGIMCIKITVESSLSTAENELLQIPILPTKAEVESSWGLNFFSNTICTSK